ncbi:hypothetical protein [Halostella pelagica]|uniref:hypothetical protein n=1 Tax=Halostella pelagica TaxID=2583824 RepID=UPI0010806AF8|nr:hypothetical protein [Halostella pelagica]
MIVVATENFELYHGVVNELRDRGVTFTTIEPGDPIPESTTVLVTDAQGGIAGGDESVPSDVAVITADPESPRRAVESALAAVRGEGGRTIVGVDPGTRPGIAVLTGETVVAAFHVPLEDAVEVIREEVADAPDPVVRVGNGARLQGATIVNDLDDVRVELVDETGTTPYLGTGARGMGDVLAAVNIARIEGDIVDEREVEPTEGELKVIKNRSREQSARNRAIDEALARRVASGDLTIDEALDEHGDR